MLAGRPGPRRSCRSTRLEPDQHRLASVLHRLHGQPAYNEWELQFREAHTEYAAPDVYMLSYGPDLNLSRPGASDADAVDLVRKLTFTVRCWFRSRSARRFSAADRLACSRCGPTTGRDDVRQLAPSSIPRVPCWWVTRSAPLIHAARVPAERGRVEFKAFDALPSPQTYPSLLALLAGLALDTSLLGRADVPDAAAHRRAARRAFDPELAESAAAVVDAAARALAGSPLLDMQPVAESVARRGKPRSCDARDVRAVRRYSATKR